MFFHSLPSALVSTIAEFLDIRSFSRLVLTNKIVKNDLKDNWVKMVQRDLAVTREEFNRVIKDEGLSPSYLYYLMYLNQRETVKMMLHKVRKGLHNDDYDAYDVYIRFRDFDMDDSFFDFDKKLSEQNQPLYDKVVSKYGENWTNACEDKDVRDVFRVFYKTYDKDKAFVMAFSYPWLTRRYENIDKIAKILGNYDIAKYLAGRGMELCDVNEEMRNVIFQCVTFPPFHKGLLYEDADLSYKKTFTPLFDL